MRATRLAAAAIAAGSLVLGMAGPALATAPPKDGQFCKKEDLGKTAKAADGTLLKCMKKAGDKQPHWYQISGEPTESPSPSPTKPTFKFGYDKVKLSSRRVAPGLSTTFTVTCPSTVTITGNGYTRNPLPVKKAARPPDRHRHVPEQAARPDDGDGGLQGLRLGPVQHQPGEGRQQHGAEDAQDPHRADQHR